MEKILAIEDSKVVQAQLQESLQGRYRLSIEEDGPSGIAAALGDPPDLILLDIYLPDMDGYTVCRTLKEDGMTRDIPVIFLTTLESEDEKVKGFEAGADDYIVKPFYPRELLARIGLHLASRRERRMAVELERLKLLREMAVALSHEINNPLTAVFCHLHMALKRVREDDGEIRNSLTEIRIEIEKIRSIVDKLAKASKVAKTEYVMGTEMIDFERI